MSEYSNDSIDEDEGEALSLSFICPQDLSQVKSRQEVHSMVIFLFKILNQNSITLIPQDLLSAPLLHQLHICLQISENVLELVKSGTVKKYLPFCMPSGKDNAEDIAISVIPQSNHKDVLGKMINCEGTGVYLSSKETKLLFSLVIGGIRDSAVKEIDEGIRGIARKQMKKKRRCVKIKKELGKVEQGIERGRIICGELIKE